MRLAPAIPILYRLDLLLSFRRILFEKYAKMWGARLIFCRSFLCQWTEHSEFRSPQTCDVQRELGNFAVDHRSVMRKMNGWRNAHASRLRISTFSPAESVRRQSNRYLLLLTRRYTAWKPRAAPTLGRERRSPPSRRTHGARRAPACSARA